MAVVQRFQPSPANKMSSEGTVSRLAQMQARFQQRQQQEKEQKLLALYAEQAQQAYSRINGGGGKVRQLFQERRSTKPGLDRSYPLQPLESRRGTSLDRAQPLRNNTKRAASQIRGPTRYPSAGYEGEDDYIYRSNNNIYSSNQRIDQDYIEYQPRSNFVKQQQKQQVFADENDYFSRSYDLDSAKIFKKLPNIGGAPLAEQKTMMAPAKEQDLKKPALQANRPKPVEPPVKSLTKAMSRLSTTKKPEVKVSVNSTNNSENKPKAGVRRPTPVPTSNSNSRPSSASNQEQNRVKSETKMATRPTATRTSSKPSSGGVAPAGNASSRSDLIACDICGRNFANDRITAHKVICAKTSKKKRKPFDPVKQRLLGTGAENYLKKGKPTTPPQVNNNLKKSNWRKKHEEFINNIRAAKMAQAHVAAGGKLSDLPPPPPMDTSDLIPCPHCGRKFNDAAAARHIPKCATMLHNKPKPQQQQASRMQAAKKRY